MHRRGLALVALALLALGSAGCSNDDEEPTTTESGSTKSFCTAAGELAGALQTEQWQPGVPVEISLARTFTALDDVAASAPEEMDADAQALRSGLEQAFAPLDGVKPVGDPPDPALQAEAQAGLQKANRALADATPVVQRMAAFVQQSCPGTTLPTVTVPPPGG